MIDFYIVNHKCGYRRNLYSGSYKKLLVWFMKEIICKTMKTVNTCIHEFSLREKPQVCFLAGPWPHFLGRNIQIGCFCTQLIWCFSSDQNCLEHFWKKRKCSLPVFPLIYNPLSLSLSLSLFPPPPHYQVEGGLYWFHHVCISVLLSDQVFCFSNWKIV